MKKIARRRPKVNAEVLGLDLARDSISYCRLDRRGDEARAGSIGGGREDLLRLLEREVGRRHTHFAFEACGSSMWVYDLLVARYGRERVHLGQPRAVIAIANSKDKSDRNDAYWLAYLAQEGRLPEAYVPEGRLRELRLAVRERIAAVQRRSRAVVRLRALLAQLGERLPTEGFFTQGAEGFLTALTARVGGCAAMAIEEARGEISALAERIERWEKKIAELAADLPDVEAIAREIPGVGKTLAATIVAEAGAIRRYRSPQAFARATGLTPSDRSTGGRQIHGHISREGSPYLRWALVQAVVHCLIAKRGAPRAVAQWTRAKARRVGGGKARVAAARKLAESIWRLFHYGEAFDAAKPYGASLGVPAATA